MIGAFAGELFAIRRRPAAWIVGGAWVVLGVGFGMVVPYLVYLALSGKPATSGTDPRQLLDQLLPDQLVPTVVSLYPLFGSALMLILGAVVAGGEYRWGTMGTLLSQRPSRVGVVLAKTGALAVALALVTVALFLLAAATSGVLAAITHRPVHWPDPLTVLAGAGAAWLVSMAAAGLGMALATAFRGPAAAIGVGLMWLLALENLVSGLAGTVPALRGLQRLLVGPNGGSLATHLGSATQDSGGIPGVVSVSGPVQAALVLSAYVVASVLVTTLLVRRRDVP